MNPTRRDFLKITTVGGAAAAVFGFDLKPAYAQLRTLKIARANETRSTCPYCSADEVTEVQLSDTGALLAWTAVTAPPPGYRGEAARLARDLHLGAVSPLDGLKKSDLLGAQVALILGT